MDHPRRLRRLGGTSHILRQRGMRPKRFPASRSRSSTGSASYLDQQTELSRSANYHSSNGFCARQGRFLFVGSNRSKNRPRRCGQRPHIEKTAFKYPFIPSDGNRMQLSRCCGSSAHPVVPETCRKVQSKTRRPNKIWRPRAFSSQRVARMRAR